MSTVTCINKVKDFVCQQLCVSLRVSVCQQLFVPCFNSCITKMKGVFVCASIAEVKKCLCFNSCVTKMKSVFVYVLIAKMKSVSVCQQLCVRE